MQTGLHFWARFCHPSCLEPTSWPTQCLVVITGNCKRIALDFGLAFGNFPPFSLFEVFDDYLSNL